MEDEFEKKYSVYIEEDGKLMGEYMYCQPEHAPKKKLKRNFILTYFFKKIGKDRNPMMVIDNITGDDFKNRHDIILDFEKNCALIYSVETEGLLHGILDQNEDMDDFDDIEFEDGAEDEQ